MENSSDKTNQLTCTCSKSTTETLEKDVTYVQSLRLKHQIDIIDVVLVFLLLTLNIDVVLVF